MSVREWIQTRSVDARPELMEHVLSALGTDSDLPESRTAEVCLDAAGRLLQRLIADERFARDSAVDLLAVDALTTFAFEHASVSRGGREAMESLVNRGVATFGRLATRV